MVSVSFAAWIRLVFLEWIIIFHLTGIFAVGRKKCQNVEAVNNNNMIIIKVQWRRVGFTCIAGALGQIKKCTGAKLNCHCPGEWVGVPIIYRGCIPFCAVELYSSLDRHSVKESVFMCFEKWILCHHNRRCRLLLKYFHCWVKQPPKNIMCDGWKWCY